MKIHATAALVALLLTIPAFATTDEPERGGPPPPGYEKIVGEPVPNWKPSDMVDSGATVWTPLGPRPIKFEYWSGTDDASGRVVSIAPHPVNANTVYIAAASGGIWKTVDGGGTWMPLTDELSILNHGCVALDPSDPDVVYVGTGEYTTRSTGDGIFRSTDAGATWSRIGTVANVGVTCSGLIVDPSDPLTIHISGDPKYSRTTDGGATWSSPFTTTRGVSALAMKSGDPSTLYLGEHDVGLWRSTNGGTTWSQLTSNLPSTGMSRILVATSASVANNVVTAFISGISLQGLYRSTNSGGSFTQLTATPDFPWPQAWYDAFVVIDPASDATMYAGGVFPTYANNGVIKTTNTGASWTDITCPGGVANCLLSPNPHPDMHAMAFGPGGTLWLGNDGGVWKSTDAGATWINTNQTLTVTQNYQIAVDPMNTTILMGGTQDNGTVERQAAIDDWPQIQAGDGGYLEYDFLSPSRRYMTYVYLLVYRKVGAGSLTNISGPWGPGGLGGDRKNFIAPLVMDPNDSDALLGGTYRVWRTTNASTSATWSAISPDLTGGGELNAIDVADGDSSTIFTGSDDGRVYVTTNASTWNNRSTGLPPGSVTDVLIDPNDHLTAYVSFSNTTGARVLMTANQGVSWTDVTGDLPVGVAGRALAVDYRLTTPLLVLGSGAGVWTSWDGGATWMKDQTDLPNVNIGDLHIDETTDTIFAGTYGRGAWRADVSSFTTSIFSDGFESGDTSAWSSTVP